MKSKLLISIGAAVAGIALTVAVLSWRFSQLPSERPAGGSAWWAPSPYEWRVLGKVDAAFNPDFKRNDVPTLYSPLKIRSYIGRESYFNAVDEMRLWMVTDLTHNGPELWRALLSKDVVPATTPGFKEVLNAGFGGASEDCSLLKTERAFRIRKLENALYAPAMSYLEGCKSEKGVWVLGRIEKLLEGGASASELSSLKAQVGELRAGVDSKSLLAALLDQTLRQIDTVK